MLNLNLCSRCTSPLPIQLLDHDNVGKPRGVVDLSYEPNGRQLGHFLLYYSEPLFTYLSLPLGDNLGIFTYGQSMTMEAWVDTKHVCHGPGKQVSMLSDDSLYSVVVILG